MTDTTTSAGARPPQNGTTLNSRGGIQFPIGTPVIQSLGAATVVPGQATSDPGRRVLGLAAGAGAVNNPVPVQYAGPLRLTTAQWDALTGDVGGLVPGLPYFLGLVAGKLTRTAPSAGGQFVVSVGIATSTRDMIVIVTPAPHSL